MEVAYNELLDKVTLELSMIISSGEALETLQKDFSVAMNDEKISPFN